MIVNIAHISTVMNLVIVTSLRYYVTTVITSLRHYITTSLRYITTLLHHYVITSLRAQVEGAECDVTMAMMLRETLQGARFWWSDIMLHRLRKRYHAFAVDETDFSWFVECLLQTLGVSLNIPPGHEGSFIEYAKTNHPHVKFPY